MPTVTNSTLPIACCPLQVVHRVLQIAYCILHSAYAIAPIAYCLVPYCLLRSPENIRLFQTPHCLHPMLPPIRSRTSTTHTDHSKYLKSNSNSYKNTSWNHNIRTDTTSYIPTLPFATTQRLNTSKHENNSTIYKHCSYITIPII